MATWTDNPITAWGTDADTYMRQASSAATASNLTSIKIGRLIASGKAVRPLLDMDISGFPGSSSDITQVKFSLYKNSGPGGLGATWNRCTGPSGTDPVGVSWLNWAAGLGKNWINPGGDFTGTDSQAWTVPTANGWFDLIVTSGGLLNLVKDALDSRSGRLLLIAKLDVEFGTKNNTFFASTNAASNKPKVELTYSTGIAPFRRIMENHR